MNEEELHARLAGIEQRLDAQLIWQAAVTPLLISLLRMPSTGAALQMEIVSLIEQSDALGLWAPLPEDDRARAREYAEELRQLGAQGASSAPAETGRPGSQT